MKDHLEHRTNAPGANAQRWVLDEFVGQRVKDSPIGPGTVTGISAAGFPKVNDIACAWIETEDGFVFDPRGVRKVKGTQ